MRCHVLKTIQKDGEVYVPGTFVELSDNDALSLAEKDLVAFTDDPESEIKLPTDEEIAEAEAEAKAAAAADAEEEALAEQEAKDNPPSKATTKAAK